MNRKLYMRFFLSISIVCMVLWTFSFTSMGRANLEGVDGEKSLSEIQQKLVGMGEEEKEVLQKLFGLMQEMEEMDRVQSKVALDMEGLHREVTKVETSIAAETLVYEKNRKVMEEVLKTYQRRGPASYIEMILSSENLTTLLRRINALGDLTRNTTDLLQSLEESKTKLALEKQRVADKVTLLEDQRKALKETLEKKTRLKQDLETYLASLEKEQTKYQEYLSNIDQAWSQLKPLFAETIEIFSQVIGEGDLPPGSMKLVLSSKGIKGIIAEEAFNDILSKQPFPTELKFGFSDNRLEMTMPKKNISLVGTFGIVEGQRLVFEVEEGLFFGMPIQKSAMEELFKEGNLELDLGPALGKNKLKSIEIYDGKIELQISPGGF